MSFYISVPLLLLFLLPRILFPPFSVEKSYLSLYIQLRYDLFGICFLGSSTDNYFSFFCAMYYYYISNAIVLYLFEWLIIGLSSLAYKLLKVQGLGPPASSAGGTGLIPGQRTKTPNATAWSINKYINQ